jgi:hypothetical protein
LVLELANLNRSRRRRHRSGTGLTGRTLRPYNKDINTRNSEPQILRLSQDPLSC